MKKMALTALKSRVEGTKPLLLMVTAQIVFAGLNILYKMAVDRGMSLRVLVTYRFLIGAAFLAPIAFFLERKNRKRLTWIVLLESFACGLFGGSLTQNLYIASMKMTSASFVTAINNLLPTTTFVLAIIFRMERLAIRTVSGQAKVIGTAVGIGGAMLLSFYKGVKVQLWSVGANFLRHQEVGPHQEMSGAGGNRALGSLLAVTSNFSFAIWLIIQAKMSEHYPHPYTSSVLLCLMASIQSACFAVVYDRDSNAWKLGWDVKLLTVVYAGVLVSGIMLTVTNWCVQRKGPLFVSVFNPLMLIVVVVLGSFFLNETIHLGSVLGGVLIVLGLYAVLWGKSKEAEESVKLPTRISSFGAPGGMAAIGAVCPSSPISPRPPVVDAEKAAEPNQLIACIGPEQPVLKSPNSRGT